MAGSADVACVGRSFFFVVRGLLGTAGFLRMRPFFTMVAIGVTTFFAGIVVISTYSSSSMALAKGVALVEKDGQTERKID